MKNTKSYKKQTDINRGVMYILSGINNVHPISCFECKESFCCRSRQSVDISERERKLLVGMFTDQHRKRGLIAIQSKILTDHYTCPFLDDDGRCSVYECRPLACSSYAVTSEPSGCEGMENSSYYIDRRDIFRYMDKKTVKEYATSESYELLDIFR